MNNIRFIIILPILALVAVLSAPKAKALSDLEQATQDAYFVIENYYNDSPENIADYCVFYAYDFSEFNGSLTNNGIRTLVYKQNDVTAGNYPQYSGILAAFNFGGQSQSYVSLNNAIVFAGTSNTPWYYGSGTNFVRRPSQGHIWNLGIRSEHLVNPFIIHGSVSSSAVYGLPFDSDVLRAQYVQETFVAGESTVDNPSSLGMLRKMYDIFFVPEYCSSSAGDVLLNKSYPVVLVDVQSDTGYNLISLQVPDLYIKKDVVFYGRYRLKSRESDKYYFHQLKFSLATEKPVVSEEDIDQGFYLMDDVYYRLNVDNNIITNSSSLSVNSLSFLYNTTYVNYTNRSLTTFDYSSNNDVYPDDVFFYGVGSINGYSSGSFLFNFEYGSLNNVSDDSPVSPEDIPDLEKQGREDNDDTRGKTPYIPQSVLYPALDDNFVWSDSGDYDFSSVSDVLEWFFFNDFIFKIALACCVVGLVGYVLYGKA